MPAVAVHIGAPKTATSYIQTWLRRNRQRLSEYGVFAPERPIHAHRLAVEHLSGSPWDTRPDVLAIRNTPLEEARATFTAAANANQNTVTVISSEYFFYADPAKVAPALTEYFGADLDIVVYIRSQCDLLLSGHNQDVKRLGKAVSRPKPGYYKIYDWGLLLDAWAKEFGKERLKAISFDISSRDRSILRDFVSAACPAVASPLANQCFEDVGVQNESLPADLLEFKRITNSLGNSGIYDYQWLEELLRAGYSGPKFGVSEPETAAWRSFYAKSNDYVAREYFNGASGDEIFPLDPKRTSGVDLEGHLSIDLIAKLLAFAVQRQDSQHNETQQRVRALENQLAKLRQRTIDTKQ